MFLTQGPVYRVTWSPFVSTMFLSCSADWSVKLWNQECTTPLHSFHAAQVAILYICLFSFETYTHSKFLEVYF